MNSVAPKSKSESESESKPKRKLDVVIVGGGLAGGLTALRFSIAQPDLKILLIERGKKIGSDRTWDFHDSDLPIESKSWLQPLISASWPEHQVMFPKFSKTFNSAYHAIRPADFHSFLRDRLGGRLRLNTEAETLTESTVQLKGGDTIHASLVLDARGLEGLPPDTLNGFRKFIGYDVVLEQPHGLKGPILTDATCPQLDGYRFFSLLPWDERRLLIREVFHSDSSTLNAERIDRSLRAYAERHGWKIRSVERRESAVLPIPMTSDSARGSFNSLAGEALPIGMRGGYFHATTGDPLPDAVRIAEFLSSLPEASTRSAREGLAKFRRGWLSRQRFYRMLNRLLFHASEPSLRYLVLQRFYELPQEVIERYHAGQTGWSDRLRLLSHRPSVPLERTLKSLREKSILERVKDRAQSQAAETASTDTDGNKATALTTEETVIALTAAAAAATTSTSTSTSTSKSATQTMDRKNHMST